MMTDAELDELGKDIVKKGLKQPIVVWTPDRFENLPTDKQPSEESLLDGRNRLEAIERQTVDRKQREEAILHALRGALRLYGDTNPYEYVVSLHLLRRHHTSRQKRELVEKLLKENPGRSDRATARIAQVNHETVGTVRAGLEATGGIRQFKKTWVPPPLDYGATGSREVASGRPTGRNRI